METDIDLYDIENIMGTLDIFLDEHEDDPSLPPHWHDSLVSLTQRFHSEKKHAGTFYKVHALNDIWEHYEQKT